MATATIWTQANDKFRYNRSATTGLSLGTGYMGGEVAAIIPLGDGRQMACMGDTYIATASGQQGLFGPNGQAPTNTNGSGTTSGTAGASTTVTALPSDNDRISYTITNNHGSVSMWLAMDTAASVGTGTEILAGATATVKHGPGRKAAFLAASVANVPYGWTRSVSSTPSAPRTKLINNAILIFDNADLSAAGTPAVYYRTTGDGDPTAFFQPHMMPGGEVAARSVVNGAVIDGKLLIGGHYIVPWGAFGFDIAGYWYALVDNIADADPLKWQTTMFAQSFIGQPFNRVDLGNCGITDQADGYLTYFGAGPGESWSAARIPKAQVMAGNMTDPAWWDGLTGWRRDRRQSSDKEGARGMRRTLFGFTLPRESGGFQLSAFPGFGRVHKRSDAKWQITAGFFPPLQAVDIPPAMHYTVTPTSALAQFPAYTQVYTIPESTADGSIYNCTSQPQLTWSAKAADDQVWTYNFNPESNNSDFFPRVLKATGLT